LKHRLSYTKASIEYVEWDPILVDHEFKLSREREGLLNIVDNLYPIIHDFIEYLEGVAVDLLRRYKPDELEEFKCPRCSATMPEFEREYHMSEHEFDKVRRIIEGYEILDKSRYPLVYKYFEYEITILIREKMPMFKGLAEEINRRIEERRLKSLSINHLYLIGDVLEKLKTSKGRLEGCS